MIYYKLIYSIDPLDPFRDLMIAQLGEINFESFEYTDNGFIAYVAEKDFEESDKLTQLEEFPNVIINYSIEKEEDQNWNEEWEKNFSPITIDDKCHIRATFHPEKSVFPYEIVIDPKMSFGTGHHQTTSMMVSLALELDFDNLHVLDMGAGTAVLAILAGMKNAQKITAIDIDDWAYNNAKENTALNGFAEIEVKLGGAEILGEESYDVIFANINRNILLNDIPAYHRVLKENGRLLLSGFYEEDQKVIENKCLELGMKLEKKKNIDNWIALQFKN